MDGFIIGASIDTSSTPDNYWDGAAFNDDINAAEFFTELGAARVSAGNLQATYSDRHIEAYGAIKTIVHDPELAPDGI